MPRSYSVQRVLAQAEKEEKKYDWLRAIRHYDNARKDIVEKRDFLKVGEIQEKIGNCFYRAAMQAGKRRAFRRRIQLSIEAYRKAQEFYGKTEGPFESRELRCDAFIKYLGHWLTSDPDEKRRLLDDCLELEGRALAGFLKTGDPREYARTYNRLSLVFFFRVFLEVDRQTLREVLEKGLRWGEQVIGKLAEHDDLVAGVYFTLATCLSDAGYYLTSESEEIEQCRSQAVEYLEKAAGNSEKVGDAILSGLSHLWLGINAGEEEATRHHEKAFEYGRLSGDNFLIGNGLDYLAYDTYWKARGRAVEDPETRRELAEKAMRFYEDAHRHYSIISFISPRGGLIGPPSGQAEHYYQIALWEPDPRKRQEFLEKSESLGMDALTLAEKSGMPMVIAQVLHVISKTLQAQARIESSPKEKKNRLQEALRYRERTIKIQEQLTPFFYWNLGVMLNYLAGIKMELADVEPDQKGKIRILNEARASLKKCLRLCGRVMPDFEKKGEITLFAALRDYQETYATLLTRLYGLTRKPEYLREAIEALYEGIRSADKLDMASLTAGLYWKAARAQAAIGEHSEAASDFEQAAESYFRAAEKIPQLDSFFKDHATYMQAWNEIEKARSSHAQKAYGAAKEHYEKAASLHKSTERWNYLTSNYLAWARLEEAEERSREEQVREAIKSFQEAAKLFSEANRALRATSSTIQDEDEKDLVERLIKALGIREEYCSGRIAVEEGKILGRQGNNTASSKKYGLAAKRFQKVMRTIEDEPSFTEATVAKDRQELKPIIYLSKAWQMMKKAEASASPELYLEASSLFDKAKEHSSDERARLLAMGHSRFCKALEAGTRFEDSRDTKLYLDATRNLESAANYYVKAGFKIASKYAIATQRLFDAYVYINSAAEEADPQNKAKYYLIAEKVLQTSIQAYAKAKDAAKSKQVQRLLEKIRGEKQLAMSLTEVLNAPTVTSSTASFVTPTPTEEMPVGLEKFEQATTQANIQFSKREISIGEPLNVKLQITNVGKQTILLDKVGGIVPTGFEIIAMPNYCHLENTDLNMRGKRLDSLNTEEINLVLMPFETGMFKVESRVIHTDENGDQNISRLDQTAIKVSKIILQNRIATGYEEIDNLLFGGIPESHAVMLSSPSCDERDALIDRFLRVGAEEGQTTFWITTRLTGLEKLAKDYQSNFFLFICNPQADKSLEDLPNISKLKGVENLTDINIALTSALRRMSVSTRAPRRCCIQIVSDVLLQHKALQTRRWLNGLLPQLRSTGFTVLAVMDPGMHALQEIHAVLDLFDGEIRIYERNNLRFLKIERMTNQEYLGSELPLSKEKSQRTQVASS